MNDAELIERSVVDGASFALLFDRHFRPIHRFLRGRAGAEVADELASETFAIAFRRRSAYDVSRVDARPWLFGIAVNLLRERRRSEERQLRAYARVGLDEGGSHAAVEGALDSTLATALLELSLEDRNLILLFAWAELSYEQLAEALCLPVGTVRSRLSRARAKLRASLGAPEATLAEEGQRS